MKTGLWFRKKKAERSCWKYKISGESFLAEQQNGYFILSPQLGFFTGFTTYASNRTYHKQLKYFISWQICKIQILCCFLLAVVLSSHLALSARGEARPLVLICLHLDMTAIPYPPHVHSVKFLHWIQKIFPIPLLFRHKKITKFTCIVSLYSNTSCILWIISALSQLCAFSQYVYMHRNIPLSHPGNAWFSPSSTTIFYFLFQQCVLKYFCVSQV